MIAASVGLAIPSNKNDYGYLSEHHSFGETNQEAGDYAEDLAASMLAKSLGVEFDLSFYIIKVISHATPSAQATLSNEKST